MLNCRKWTMPWRFPSILTMLSRLGSKLMSRVRKHNYTRHISTAFLNTKLPNDIAIKDFYRIGSFFKPPSSWTLANYNQIMFAKTTKPDWWNVSSNMNYAQANRVSCFRCMLYSLRARPLSFGSFTHNTYLCTLFSLCLLKARHFQDFHVS